MAAPSYETFREGREGRLEAHQAQRERSVAGYPVEVQRDVAHSRDWLADIEQTLPAWQQPQYIDANHELGFAMAVRKHVANHLTSMLYAPGTFKIINGDQTDESLTEYYQLYPSNDERPEARLAKRTFQQPYIELVKWKQHEYSELQIASGLWIRLRNQRRYQHAARSVFGLLTGYGMALESERYRLDQRND